jgi:hypothetical protein
LLSSDAHFCGPLRVTVDAESTVLRNKVVETLILYDRRWPAHDHSVEIRIRTAADAVAEPATGTFLRCARITVDVAESGLHATTLCGARSRVWQTARMDRWDIDVPAGLIATANLEDVEELIILALTTGWRSAGWVPVHAAAVTDGSRCAVICAPSGGGKSTLSAAFVRRGWRTIGDDKLLLRVVDGRSHLAALQRTFNLHPCTSAWFPEVGDLERLPRYSTWTAKRKVKIESIWPEPAADGAHPTHLLRVRRAPESGGIVHTPLGPGETLTTLLRQVAIPSDRSTASHILSAVAPTARGMRGLDVVVGENAYGRADALDALIGALQ